MLFVRDGGGEVKLKSGKWTLKRRVQTMQKFNLDIEAGSGVLRRNLAKATQQSKDWLHSDLAAPCSSHG